MTWRDDNKSSKRYRSPVGQQLIDDLSGLVASIESPPALFDEITRRLQKDYDISKGFLALREGDQTRFLASATFNRGRTRRNLSLRLPTAGSLFEKVAEHGQIYSESFAELFDGNLIERRLLLDDDTASFMLRPLRHEARLVGLLGYSSDQPETFVTVEEGRLDEIFALLAERLSRFAATPYVIQR